MKWKGEASEQLNRQICRVKRQSRCRVKRKVLNVGGEYTKNSNYLEVDGVEFYLITLYTPHKNKRAERTNCTIKDGIQTWLIQAGAP